MAVNSISNTTNVNSSEQIPTNTGFSGLDASSFMQILLAQLRHQNPLEPMDDTQLIAQMTQLNSLEELKKISLGIESLILLNQG